MNLEIDYRERDIIELFKDTGINYKVCNLIIGDFIIKNENQDILFVIERKSIKDLCSSILDGRLAEQRSRLIESIQDPKKIIYIIEGSKKDELIHGKTLDTSKKSINSSILNLIFKHQYKVIFTEYKQDTVDNIILLYTKIKELNLNIDVDNIQPIKIIKKSDKINDNIFINMLSVIPGISIKIAIKIHEKYNTFNDLMIAYNLIESIEIKKKMLSEIQVTQNRKIGKAVSERIYYSIYGNKANDGKVIEKKIIKSKKFNNTCLL